MAHPMLREHSDQLLALLGQSSDLTVFELLLRTGARTHELKNMTLYSDRVHITAAKDSENHYIPLPEAFIARLQCYWPQLQADLTKYSHESYKAILRVRWAKFKSNHPEYQPYSLHSLRSAFAIRILTATNDIMLTKTLLGHKSLASTASYLRIVQMETRRDEILKAVG